MQELGEALGEAGVLVSEEGSGKALLSGTACAPDAVHIVVHIGGEIKVDDMRHVGNIQTTSSHVSGHQDGGAARPEAAQRLSTNTPAQLQIV